MELTRHPDPQTLAGQVTAASGDGGVKITAKELHSLVGTSRGDEAVKKLKSAGFSDQEAHTITDQGIHRPPGGKAAFQEISVTFRAEVPRPKPAPTLSPKTPAAAAPHLPSRLQLPDTGLDNVYSDASDSRFETSLDDNLLTKAELGKYRMPDGNLSERLMVADGAPLASAKMIAKNVRDRGGLDKVDVVGANFDCGWVSGPAQYGRMLGGLAGDIGSAFANITDAAQLKTALKTLETNARARFGDDSFVAGLVSGIAGKMADYAGQIVGALKDHMASFVGTMVGFAIAEQIPGVNIAVNAYFLKGCSESVLKGLSDVWAAAKKGDGFGIGNSVGAMLPDVVFMAMAGKALKGSIKTSFAGTMKAGAAKEVLTSPNSLRGKIKEGAGNFVTNVKNTTVKDVAKGTVGMGGVKAPKKVHQHLASATHKVHGQISNGTTAAMLVTTINAASEAEEKRAAKKVKKLATTPKP
ncbi:MAG: hypothetical protein H7338_04300 [Candidatus Sericytochromatia bacterium]|nr:hypothetical protein [Candidatus Sericytochromatia bacterium]